MNNQDDKGNIINKGDEVVITALGITKRGIVHYADFDRYRKCWDIECNNDYFHWKQSFDKGHIVQINGKQAK